VREYQSFGVNWWCKFIGLRRRSQQTFSSRFCPCHPFLLQQPF